MTQITSNVKDSIKYTVEGLISQALVCGSPCIKHEDYRIFVDSKAGQVAIMFLDGPEGFQAWGGHLYEIKDDKLEMLEYGCFDFVDINRWPCFNYEEVKIEF